MDFFSTSNILFHIPLGAGDMICHGLKRQEPLQDYCASG